MHVASCNYCYPSSCWSCSILTCSFQCQTLSCEWFLFSRYLFILSNSHFVTNLLCSSRWPVQDVGDNGRQEASPPACPHFKLCLVSKEPDVII